MSDWHLGIPSLRRGTSELLCKIEDNAMLLMLPLKNSAFSILQFAAHPENSATQRQVIEFLQGEWTNAEVPGRVQVP